MPKNMKVSDSELVRMIYDEVTQVRTESFDLISDQRIDSNYSFANLTTSTTKPLTNMSQVKFYFTPSAVQTLVMHGSKTFCSNKDTIEFSPSHPSEEMSMATTQLTKMVNHVLHRENDGFEVITGIMRSAAVNKNGIAKTTWNTGREVYEEVVDAQVLGQYLVKKESQGWEVEVVDEDITTTHEMIQVQDELGNIIEQESESESGTYTVRLSKMVNSIDVDVLPPEEFVINEDTTSIHNDHLTRYVGHKREVYRGDLQDMIDEWGLKIDVDDLADYESISEDYERRARHDVDGTLESFAESERQTGPASKIVLIESWLRADRDGDGFPEWVHVFSVGNTLVYDEPWYGPIPFASYTYFPIPHKFYGLSVYDRIRSYEEAATGLVRSDLDRARLQNTMRWVVREGRIDRRELESGRPGVYEVSNAFKPGEDIMALESPQGVTGAPFANLEQIRMQVTSELGIDPVSGQVSTDIEKSGNDAAKTAMTIDNASVKMEGYHRRFADGTLRDICWSIAMELVKNKDSEYVQRIVEAVTPGIPFMAGMIGFSDLVRYTSLRAKVGLGHQTGQQKIAAAQTVSAMIGQLQQNPTPAMYKLIAESLEGFGYENPAEVIDSLDYWQAEKAKMDETAAMAAQAQTAALTLEQQKFEAEFALKQQEAAFRMKLDQAETMAKIGEIEAKTGKTMEEARKIATETNAVQNMPPSEVKVVL